MLVVFLLNNLALTTHSQATNIVISVWKDSRCFIMCLNLSYFICNYELKEKKKKKEPANGPEWYDFIAKGGVGSSFWGRIWLVHIDLVATPGHRGPRQSPVLRSRHPGLRGQEVLVSFVRNYYIITKQVLRPLGLQICLMTHTPGVQPWFWLWAEGLDTEALAATLFFTPPCDQPTAPRRRFRIFRIRNTSRSSGPNLDLTYISSALHQTFLLPEVLTI